MGYWDLTMDKDRALERIRFILDTFEEIDLASNDAARAMIIEKTGHLGAPIVQIGNEFIIGYDPKKMESLLK